MSSSFLKSPSQTYSSSYGAYGSGSVNPYASYFGSTPQGQGHGHSSMGGGTPGPSTSFTASSPLVSSGTPGGAASYQYQSPSSSLGIGGGAPFISPISAFSMTQNPVFVGTPGTTSKGTGISTGSPPYFMPSPAQTKIIGGVNNSSVIPPPTDNQNKKMGSSTSPLGGGMFGGHGVRSNPSGSFGGRTLDDSSQHPEPMHYSPIGGSSPTNVMHSGGPGSVYLPCYFLGLDHYYQGVPVPQSPNSGTLGSPSGGRMMGSQGFLSPSRSFKRAGLFEPKGFHEDGERGGGAASKPDEGKKKGPPIHGFGASETKSSKDFLEMVASTEDTSGRFLHPSVSPRDSRQEPSPSSVSGSPSKCWVTIFGFPAGASSFIITNFSTLGKIMEVKCTPGSNWLHIRFSNPIEARRALNKNGKVLGQSIMVGVIPSDAKVIEEAERTSLSSSELNEGRNTYGGGSVSSGGVLRERNSMETPMRPSDSIKSKIRPLATGSIPAPPCSSTSFNSPPPTISGVSVVAREPFEVCRSADRRSVPTPSTGIITKAMEFMFGW